MRCQKCTSPVSYSTPISKSFAMLSFAMLSFSKPRDALPDKLTIPRLPPRIPRISAHRNQDQSQFFSKLPAEIRNEIYNYVFAAGAREMLSLEAHALSLLIACQQAYDEASVLAFGRYVFPLSNPAFQILISMRNAISHLSSPHVHAITAVSHDLRTNNRGFQTANIMSNAIRLFPNLKQIQLRLLRSRLPAHRTDSSSYTIHLEARDYAVRKFVPRWFYKPITGFVVGYHSTRQAGERWEVEWPQMNDDEYFRISEDIDFNGTRRLSPLMSAEAVGNVYGVQMCPCTCGSVEWVSANLVQETGRRITVDTIYHGPEYRPLPDLDAETALRIKMGLKAVILKEYAPPLDLIEQPCYDGMVSVQGYAYEPDEEYWEAKRRRNGHWMALSRGVLNKITKSSETSENSGLGSMAQKQGDWARMAPRKS
jgi:hypothetical protein